MIGSLPPRYVDVERLGEGGEGGAWVARDRDARGRRVVLKHVPAARQAQVQRAFEVLRRVASPHLPQVLALVPDQGGGVWLVSAWVDGAALPTGPVPVAEALAEAQGLTHALRALHGVGVHHGDVSLHNVIRDPEGEVVLTDFGQIGCYGCGTPGFLAPEVLGGGGGTASDVFALGCVLAARLFGEVPWREPAEVAALPGRGRAAVRARIAALAASRREALPGRLLALFEHLLDPDPEGRVGDLGALLLRLREVSTGENAHDAATWWLPARWPYRGRDLGPWIEALAGSGRPRLVAVAGPAGSGRGRVIEELVQRLQADDPTASVARLCAPERLSAAFGSSDDDGWIGAWMAGEVAGAVIGAAEAPVWPGELGDAADEARQVRLQAAVLHAGAASARSTLLLPVSAALGEALAEAADPTLAVIPIDPWAPPEIRGALAIALEGGGDEGEGAQAWTAALQAVTGGWPARVIAAIDAAARAGVVVPDVDRLAALAGASVGFDVMVAREILAVTWADGRRGAPVPGALQGLFASDGEPLGWAIAAARRILGGDVRRLARRALERAQASGGPRPLELRVDAGDREALERWLCGAPEPLPGGPALERLIDAVQGGLSLAPAALARLARDRLRRGDPGRALALVGQGEVDDACRLLKARALEHLGRPAEALAILDVVLAGAQVRRDRSEGTARAGEEPASVRRGRALGLRWRALVDLGRADEARKEALQWDDAGPADDAGKAEAMTWAAFAALTAGDEVRAQAWLDGAERALSGFAREGPGDEAERAREAGLRARIEQLRGNLAHARGDLAIAEAAYGRAAARFLEAGERGGRNTLAASLAALAVETGAISRGVAHGRQALRAWLALGQIQALSGWSSTSSSSSSGPAPSTRPPGSSGSSPRSSRALAAARARRVAADRPSRWPSPPTIASASARPSAARRRRRGPGGRRVPREAIDAGCRRRPRPPRAWDAAAAAHLEARASSSPPTPTPSSPRRSPSRPRRGRPAGDDAAFRGAAEALARLPGATSSAATAASSALRGDATLHAALVVAGVADALRLRALVARLRITLESIMGERRSLDRPAVRASLAREVEPSVAALLADLSPEDAAPRPSERPRARATTPG
ncbi:MAG: hypothetical protein R3B09_14160 [Nannocystaceae bacterium]